MSVQVLVLAGTAHWESAVLAALEAAGVRVTRRCVDVVDLMAAGSVGQAGVALVAADLARLDAEVIGHLRRYDVPVVAVGGTEHADRMQRLGAAATVEPDAVVTAVLDAASGAAYAVEVPVEDVPVAAGSLARVVAVWGPPGAPGRTTTAIALAAETAAAGRRTVLVDADPAGGTVVQHLGVLDEVSGLLAVARQANAGTLERSTLAAACRGAAGNLDVLTGLPRADRRVEVRADVVDQVLRLAAGIGAVVVDTGSSVEDGDRDRITLEALGVADEIVVVGAADPVGLTRLARAVVDVGERFPGTPFRVVLNRMRPSLRWSAAEVTAMIEGYGAPRSIHVVPDDRGRCDEALVTGRTLVEVGDSPVRAALAEVARACFPEAFPAPPPRGPSQRGSRRRGRRTAQAPKSR